MDGERTAFATETMDIAMDTQTVEKDIAQTVKVLGLRLSVTREPPPTTGDDEG